MVGGEAHLARVFFGRILIRRRPHDTARRHDVHLHALGNRDEGTGAHERADLLGVLGGDQVAGFYFGVSVCDGGCECEEDSDEGQRETEPVRFFHFLKHHFNSTASL